jgi:molybdate transport system ATP-binding protein
MTLNAVVRVRLSSAFELDVACDVQPGVTIVFGESGSGKSTLLRCLAGLTPPDAGRIVVGDRVFFDSTTGVTVPPVSRGVGYVLQQLALFPHMSVADNLAYGLSGLSPRARRECVHGIAERFHIAHVLNRRPGAISGGERQRTALARALVIDPVLLLLDEPLSALDHLTQSRIMQDLRAWNTAHQIPILYVTHSHREAFALGERMIVLERGRVLASGTPHDVLETPAHESLAQLAGFENLFNATVMERQTDAGVMHCRLDDAPIDLEVPLSVAVGADLRIAIRAGDILVANQEPRGLSARNALRGTLTAMKREGSIIVAHVDAGAPFVVHLTPTAVKSLHLSEGDHIWLVIKTHSCRTVAL